MLVFVVIRLDRDNMLYFPPIFDKDMDIDFIFRSFPFVLKINLYT